MIERLAGRYALLESLGEGGMGEVFLARDLSTGHECALKRLRPAAGVPPEILRREFELMARIRHPDVVAVREFGVTPLGEMYFTMEYVPGLPADQALEHGDWAALMFVASRLASGLEALHDAGLVHGDLKPSNVLVLGDPEGGGRPVGIRLLDFGLAAPLGREGRGHQGTEGYAAPELVRGGAPDRASDLYALGATLYRLAAGRAAFESRSPGAALRLQQAGPPPALPLEESGAPPGLVQLVLRLMSPRPPERPASARDVRLELEALHPAARRPLAERLRGAQLVGRERELARVETRLATLRGGPRISVVRGEAGTGKSALLDAVARRGVLAGRRVVRISGADAQGSGSIAGVLLRRLAGEAGFDHEGRGGVPEPVERALTPGAPLADDDQLAAAPAFAARWCRALATDGRAPLVLLDDVERLDPLSLGFVRRVAIHPEAPAMLWVWARRPRPVEPPPDEAVLAAAGVLDTVELGSLGRGDIERLIATRLHAVPSEALADALWTRAGGHPGSTVELLVAAARAGALREVDGVPVVDEARLASLDAPTDFERLRLARHAELPAAERAAALALAVWDRAATPAEVSRLDPEAAPGTLERLVREGLATRDQRGALRLAPPAIGPRLLERADPALRERLHRRALEGGGLDPGGRFRHLRALGRAEEALADAELAVLAHGDVELAEAACSLAAERAPGLAASWEARTGELHRMAGLFKTACEHFERSIALDPDPSHDTERFSRLVSAYGSMGALDRVPAVIRAAREHGAPPVLEARFRIEEVVARLEERATPEDLEALKRELERSEREGFPGPGATAAYNLAGRLRDLDRYDEALEFATRSAALADRSGRRVMGARARVLGADIVRRRDGPAAAAPMLQGVRTAIAGTRQRTAFEDACFVESLATTEAGRWVETRRLLLEVLRASIEDGRLASLVNALANLAVFEALMGHPRKARRLARSLGRLPGNVSARIRSACHRALATASRAQGRPAESERHARRALELAHRHAFASEIDWSCVEFARTLASEGRWREVREACRTVLAGRETLDTVGVVALRILVGRAAMRLGDPAAAEAAIGRAEAWTRLGEARYAAALTLQLRAEMALARHADDGPELAARALAALAEIPAPPDRAQAALDFARIALGAHETPPKEAAEWLELAESLFAGLGNARDRVRALSMQLRLPLGGRTAGAEAGSSHDLIDAVGRLLTSMSDLKALARRAMELAVERLAAERGVLLLADPETGRLEPIAELGSVDAATRREAVSYSRRVVEQVAQSGGSLLVGDAPADPRVHSQSVVDLGLRSILCVPMFVGGRVVGAVYLDDSRRAETFGDADRRMLEGFAYLMGVAIDNSRGQEEARRVNEMLLGENLQLRQAAGTRYQAHGLVAVSTPMRRVLASVAQAAQTPATTVLLTGESGTGKELLARIIHHTGKRRLRPFVAVNCGAFPESLIETELFGILDYVASDVRKRDGRFVQADGGTLFLDEIAEMPLQQQVRLLSAIATREITPVGGGRPVPVDVRIIAATHRDLRAMVERNEFREDLYYRLNVIEIEVPPLREHKADIPAMALTFAAELARQQEREVPELSPAFMAALMRSDWPGNVRELQNYIERVLAMTPGNTLYPDPLPHDLQSGGEPAKPGRERPLLEHLQDVERRRMLEALERAGGNQSLAARQLGMTEQSFRYRLRKYSILKPRHNRRTRHNRR